MFCLHLSECETGSTKQVSISRALSGRSFRCIAEEAKAGVVFARYCQCETSVTKSDHFHDENSGYIVLFRGRLDNQHALAQELNLPKGDTNGVARVIAAAWKKFGKSFAKHLSGEYSIAITNSSDGHTILVRDRMGVTPLYYTMGETYFSAATSMPALLRIPTTERQKNMRWVRDFLLHPSLCMDQEKTPYEAIFKVPAGYTYEIKNGEIISKNRYHTWEDNSPSATTIEPKYVQMHRNLLDESVAKRTPDLIPLTVEVSGGLDSATLLMILHKNHQNEIISASTVHFSLEPELISICNDAAKVSKKYCATVKPSSIEDHTRQEIEFLGYPSAQGMEVSFELYKQIKNETGSRVIYSGFGGDQVVTNMADLRITEEFNNRNYRALWSLAAGHPVLKPWRFFRLLHRRGKILNYRKNMQNIVDLFNEVTLLKANPSEDDLQQARFRSLMLERTNSSSVNEDVINDQLTDSNIQNRFETHTLMADALGMEFQWPLCDHQLIQNYISTPSIEKLGPKTTRRYLHRRAVKGMVPDTIVDKNDKYSGEPIRSIEGWDKYREFWIREVKELKVSLHSDLADLVDFQKLEKMSVQLKAGMKNDISSLELAFMESIYSVYSLDAWFKHGM
jgi:asparagine synthase (glutamine-hydrolysing)